MIKWMAKVMKNYRIYKFLFFYFVFNIKRRIVNNQTTIRYQKGPLLRGSPFMY